MWSLQVIFTEFLCDFFYKSFFFFLAILWKGFYEALWDAK